MRLSCSASTPSPWAPPSRTGARAGADRNPLLAGVHRKEGISYMSNCLRLPKAVQVAVGVDGLYLVSLTQGEADLRLVSGVEQLALVSLLGL